MVHSQVLQYQADRIEMALAAHGLRGVSVVGGPVGPRYAMLEVRLPFGVRPKAAIGLADDISHRLGMQVRVSQGADGLVYVEIPREEPITVGLAKLVRAFQKDGPRLTALLGLTVEGTPLGLRLPSPDVAHALIVGTTGSGKTVLARAIALSLAALNSPADVQLLLIDPKGTKFRDLGRLPHLLTDVILEPAHGVHVLRELESVMIERDRIGISSPRIVSIIDELADLVFSDAAILEPVARIAQRGREAGVHLVVCTQKPTVDVVGRLARANFPVRLVGSVTTPEEAKIASGQPQTSAEKLLGRGDFLLVQQGRVHDHFQAAYASPNAARELIEEIRATLPGQLDVARERRWEPPDLRVIVDNRGIERDARRVLRTPGWLEEWWDKENRRFRYKHQTAIGEIIERENAGAGHRYISQVSDRVRELLVSTSTTTTPGASTLAEKPENASERE